MTDGLVVFFKSPRLGEVKTRLAATLGEQKALKIYLDLVKRTLEVVEDWRALDPDRRKVFAWGTGDRKGFDELGLLSAQRQMGRDLGLRMERAMRETLRTCDRTAIIGVDCPMMNRDDLASAFENLGEKEVRLGPSPDGGYWLMSASFLFPGCLSGLPWSQPCTRERVVSRMEGMGYVVHFLRVLQDIDVEADLEGCSHLLGWRK